MDSTDVSNECSICWAELSEDPAPLPVEEIKKPRLKPTGGVNKDAKLSSTPCGHIFHTTCVVNWIEKLRRERNPTTCPTCRKKITKAQLRPVYLDTQGANKRDMKCEECEAYRNKLESLADANKGLQEKHESLTADYKSLETRFQIANQELTQLKKNNQEPKIDTCKRTDKEGNYNDGEKSDSDDEYYDTY